MATPDHPDTRDCYLTNAQTCSAGTGPGYATLPWDEATLLIAQGYATASHPPNMNYGYAQITAP
jgi:hypothetical protein